MSSEQDMYLGGQEEIDETWKELAVDIGTEVLNKNETRRTNNTERASVNKRTNMEISICTRAQALAVEVTRMLEAMSKKKRQSHGPKH